MCTLNICRYVFNALQYCVIIYLRTICYHIIYYFIYNKLLLICFSYNILLLRNVLQLFRVMLVRLIFF